MDTILRVAVGITACIVVGITVVPVAALWRLHRRTAHETQEQIKRIDQERRRGPRMTDHRYDPKQFRRR